MTGGGQADPDLMVRDSQIKVIKTSSGEEIEVRRLSPEEKAARRRKRNIIMIAVAAVVFAVALSVMLNM